MRIGRLLVAGAVLAPALTVAPATGAEAAGSRVESRLKGWGPVVATVRPGEVFTDRVRVRPAGHQRRFVLRARPAGENWRVAQRGKVRASGRVRLRFVPPGPGRYVLRLAVARAGKVRAVRSSVRRLVVPRPASRPRATQTPTRQPRVTPAPVSQPWRQLLPAVAPGGSFTAYAVGDVGMCGGQPELTAALIPNGALVLAAGDLAYPDGRLTDFLDCYLPFYGRLLDTTEPVPGNHEYRDPDLAYFDVFGAKVGTRSTPWYHARQGDWSFYQLNSNCDEAMLPGDTVDVCAPGGRQYQWLAQRLAADPNRCIAAMWHHPRWAATVNGNYPRTGAMYRLLLDHGADLLLAGHEHNYMRYPRLDGDGLPAAAGIREIVVGTGGVTPGNIRPEKTPTPQVWNVGTYGVLQLQFAPNGYSWEFLATDDTDLDSGSDTC